MILLFITLIGFGCKKADDGLPKASQSGENIMAAKIDGSNWVSHSCFSCIGAGYGLIARREGEFFTVTGEQQKNSPKLIIHLSIRLTNSGVGVYQLGNGTANSEFNNFARVTESDTGAQYNTTDNNKGTLTITKVDIQSKIVSGTLNLQHPIILPPGL